MPPKRRDLTDPSEWLRRAHSNLARAKADRTLPEILYEDLCFDAQQAAEKAIKAVLVQRNVAFPKNAAIMDLPTLLHESGYAVPEQIRQCGILTEYAVESRYPGVFEEVLQADYTEAVELADRVVRWAESVIRDRGGT